MKKFKFQLDGLLRIREFKEKKLKIEMGQILSEISGIEDKIKKMHEDIAEAYAEQERLLKSLTGAQMLGYFPYFIQGKKEDIKSKETLLYSLRKKFDRKKDELNKARGEVKVIDKLKEKKFEEYKHEVNKKRQEDIDDILMMRRGFSNKRGES